MLPASLADPAARPAHRMHRPPGARHDRRDIVTPVTDGAALLAYPWEFAIDRSAASTVAATGVAAVCVAGAYHAVRALRPRGDSGPVVVEQPHAAAYWPVDAARYPRRLVPAAPAAWADSARPALKRSRAAGLRAGLWLSVLHTTRLATAAPDLALVNCFGEVYRHALCPAPDDVRDYASALVREALDRLAPDWLEVEAVGFHGYRHASLHDKCGVPVDERTAYLLSLCFCPACRRRFADRGGDPDRLAARVRRLVVARLADPWSAPDDESGTAAADLAAFEAVRTDIAEETAALVAAAAHDAGVPVTLHVGVAPTTVGSRSPLTPRLAGLMDGVVVSTDGRLPDDAEQDVATAVALVGDRSSVLVSVRAFAPDVRSGDDVHRRLSGAAAVGAAGARVHTFGLISDEQVRWVADASPWR